MHRLVLVCTPLVVVAVASVDVVDVVAVAVAAADVVGAVVGVVADAAGIDAEFAAADVVAAAVGDGRDWKVPGGTCATIRAQNTAVAQTARSAPGLVFVLVLDEAYPRSLTYDQNSINQSVRQ